jgi:hypothetical protein
MADCIVKEIVARKMIVQCCDECMSQRKVHEWVEIFKE